MRLPGVHSSLDGLRTRTVEELAADPELLADIQWAVDGLIPIGSLTIVYGLPKVGKGTLVTNLAKCVAAGERWLGKATKVGNVLWLDLEQHVRLTARKFIDEGAKDLRAAIHVYNGVPPKLAQVEETIVARQPTLVVVDSLSRLLLLEDENAAAEVTAALAPIIEMAHRRNVAMVAIHHSRKSEGEFGSGMRGSSAFFAVADVAINIKRMHESSEDDTGRRKLVCISRYDEANETLVVRRDDTGYSLEESPVERRKKAVLASFGSGPMEASAVGKRVKLSRPVVYRTLSALCTEGRLLRLGAGTKTDRFTYTLALEDSSHDIRLTSEKLQHS